MTASGGQVRRATKKNAPDAYTPEAHAASPTAVCVQNAIASWALIDSAARRIRSDVSISAA